MDKIKSFFLQSSADPSKLSKTMEGIMATIVSIVALFVSFHGGQPINQDVIDQLIQSALLTISSVGAAIGTLVTFWGLLRKFVLYFKS